jgi:hypothetical protein
MERETVVVNAPGQFRISWGAIFGGTLVALGVWLLLHTLGLAAGLTAIDPNNPRSLRGVGIGTGIWSIVAPLIALFVGGYVAARSAGVLERGLGALHGAVLWGLTTVAGAAGLGLMLASVVNVGVQVSPDDLTAAAHTTGKALWGVFFALLLGLVSAAAGGLTGVRRRSREVAVTTPTVAPTVVAPAPTVVTGRPVTTETR